MGNGTSNSILFGIGFGITETTPLMTGPITGIWPIKGISDAAAAWLSSDDLMKFDLTSTEIALQSIAMLTTRKIRNDILASSLFT